MVVRTNLTTPNDLTAAAASLRQINTPIAGLVVFEEQVVEPYYYHPVAEDGDPRARDHAVYS
jgi:hypothetical protein